MLHLLGVPRMFDVASAGTKDTLRNSAANPASLWKSENATPAASRGTRQEIAPTQRPTWPKPPPMPPLGRSLGF